MASHGVGGDGQVARDLSGGRYGGQASVKFVFCWLGLGRGSIPENV